MDNATILPKKPGDQSLLNKKETVVIEHLGEKKSTRFRRVKESVGNRLNAAIPNWLQKLALIVAIIFAPIAVVQKFWPKDDIVAQSYRPWLSFRGGRTIAIDGDSILTLSFKVANTGFRTATLLDYRYCLLTNDLNFQSGRTLNAQLFSKDTIGWSFDFNRTIVSGKKQYYIADENLKNLIVAYKILYKDDLTKQLDSTLYMLEYDSRQANSISMRDFDPNKQDSLFEKLNGQGIFWQKTFKNIKK
jgi:hypothetical protein